MSLCEAPECGKKRMARGLCSAHYHRLERRGLLGPRRDKTLDERLWEKVDKTPTCWNWTGKRTPEGYGHITMRVGGKWTKRQAHRVAYELTVGPIPEGMQLDHTCHNASCVNPDHLRPATPNQNQQNISGARANSSTGIRGVFPTKNPGRWRAMVGHNGKQHYLGVFHSMEDAEAAAIAKRNELYTHNDMDRIAS